MALAQVAFSASTPIASALSGPLFGHAGFAGTFGICAGCGLITLVYFAATIQETRGKPGHQVWSLTQLNPFWIIFGKCVFGKICPLVRLN